METANPVSANKAPSSPHPPDGPSTSSGFQTDVFISYTHIDNMPLVPGEEGWIANLHHVLSARLPQLVGGNVQIWRDPKLDGNDFISDTLVDGVRKSALMVAVFSPRYVRSEFCRLEIETFARSCADTELADLGTKSRMFKVIKTPVPGEEQPAQFRDLLGYEFYAVDPGSQKPREFRQDVGANKDLRYWDKLEDLAYDIAKLIEVLQSAEPQVSAPGDAPAVYLAATSSDLSAEYDLVRRELQQRGHRVLPDKPLPNTAADVEQVVAEYLEQSRLAVHLFGRNYGLVPEGTELSLPELQNRIAAERARETGLQRLIWLSPDTEAADERQRSFIHRLETDATSQANADLLRTDLGELKRVMMSRLEPVAEESAPKTDGAVPKDVYLIYAPEDFDAAAPLEDALFEAGCELLTPLIDAEGNADLDEHRANLEDCEAVLLFQGEASEQWLRERLREIEQLPARIVRGVFLGAPENPRKQRLRTRKALVMKQFDEFEPAHLEPFFAELHRAAEELEQ